MIVRVISQKENGDLLCESHLLGVIAVDPFVGCAIDTDDVIGSGAAMVGKRYNMAEYWLNTCVPECYLCHYFDEIPELSEGPKE
jgi:hypothetical protein